MPVRARYGEMVDASVLQSMLDPAGPQAANISRLWWLAFWISTLVFVVVLGFLLGAIVRAVRLRRDLADEREIRLKPDLASEAAWEPVLKTAVTLAVGGTVLTLFVLLIASIRTGRAIASPRRDAAVVINIVGHQWWWEAEYEDALPSQRFKTANELHIPVGRPIVLKVTSHDVIHSFWVPNLHGKRDLIPGYTTSIWLQADRPGIFRGQCAEFCGYQHANMSLYVTAESDAEYQRWAANQRKPAVEPSDETTSRGREVFLRSTCTQCHTIRGTIAGAILGPDLTHLATRGTIAAGRLPNSRGHLAGWVVDAQGIKPGSRMPPNSIPGDDLQALLTYLESLK
jgi:cytochrome c oxidase subunit II